MSGTATHELVQEGFGYLNAHNLDAFFNLYAADLSNPSLATIGLPTNKEGFQMFVDMFYSSFSQPQFLPQTVVCEGDTTAFRWIFKATHTAEFMGIAPTGKAVEITAFTSFKVGDDGKVIEQYDLADMVTLLKQIGAMA